VLVRSPAFRQNALIFTPFVAVPFSKFAAILEEQGVAITLGDLSVRRFALPQPTAPYPGKSDLYGEVFCQIGQVLGA
jgi:hypothetical protein